MRHDPVFTMRVRAPRVACALATCAVLAALSCSDDSSSGDDGGAAGTGGSPLQPFNGDCTTAKWAGFSDACWSCMCTACANTLNACNEACTGVMGCAFQAGCLVNQTRDINCEVRCVASECLVDAGAAAQAVINFDTCLITATKPSGFRVCEDVCAIPYTGDVCTRYP